MKIYIPMSVGYEGIEKIYGYFDEDHKELAERIGKAFNVTVYDQELNQFDEEPALEFLEETGLHEYRVDSLLDEEISLTTSHDTDVCISNTLSLLRIEGHDTFHGFIWATSKEHARQEFERLQRKLEEIEFDDGESKFLREEIWTSPEAETLWGGELEQYFQRLATYEPFDSNGVIELTKDFVLNLPDPQISPSEEGDSLHLSWRTDNYEISVEIYSDGSYHLFWIELPTDISYSLEAEDAAIPLRALVKVMLEEA